MTRVAARVPQRLRILHASPIPASPPHFGAQARVHGLLTEMARRADVTALAAVDDQFDLDACRKAMESSFEKVVLVPNSRGGNGASKRMLQVRSLASHYSYERHQHRLPAFKQALDSLLRQSRYDLISLEFPYLAHYLPEQPPVVLNTHEIAYDLARQIARDNVGLTRRIYHPLNWRKLRREELAAFRAADGICACSAEDERRILAQVPGARTTVIPNAADTDKLRPRPADPPPDGRTVLFFALLSTYPNQDGVRFLLQEIWPRIAAARPDARLKIAGAHPSEEVRAQAGHRIEVTGFVEDLRPHLAAAAVIVVPLRIGGGTRLKIVESMAMGKAIVSTRLGAEGIQAVASEHICYADDAPGFADAVVRLLDDPGRAARMGQAARRLAEGRYSWRSAAESLDGFYHEVLEAAQVGARSTP